MTTTSKNAPLRCSTRYDIIDYLPTFPHRVKRKIRKSHNLAQDILPILYTADTNDENRPTYPRQRLRNRMVRCSRCRRRQCAHDGYLWGEV